MNSPRRALVVTFDHFPASILGCYGNEWIETPHLDRLAANGVVADACCAAHIQPSQFADVFFPLGQPARGASKGISQIDPSLRRGLVFETGTQLDFSLAGFNPTIAVDGERGPWAKPDRIPLAEMVRRGQSAWTDEQPQLLWLHARGLTIPAAPPEGFAELYQDEFEDRGVKFEALSESERASHPLATAGMASLIDHWLGELFSIVAAEPNTLIVVTAAQGTIWQSLPNSFGEFDELRSQAVHVPWIVSAAGIPAGRLAGPISTQQLGPLLTAWLGGSDELIPRSSEPVITRGFGNSVRIANAQWSAIFPGTKSTEPLLFAKPEDFWEVNNLAGATPEVVERLRVGVQASG